MLKKRILASSMASVMALSAVSVVAFADETATSDIKTEVVTLAQLKEYVKSFEKFVDDELEDYGTIQEGWFNDALDAAQATIDSRFSTEDDITAAYQMLKAVYEKLAMYTQDDLKTLIDECKTDYDSENKYNKNFGDAIWGTTGWNKFVDAYEHAEDYVDSDDPADLNDAYLELETTHDALSPNKFVTKSDFRKAFDAYSKIAGEFSNYEDWMRGTVSVNPTTTTYKDGRNNTVALSGASYITFGELKNIVYGTSDDDLWVADEDNGRKRIGEPANAAAGKWINFYGDVAGVATTDVNDFVETAYDYFLDNADSTVTTDGDIVKAYEVAVDAVKVFNGWKAVTVKGSSERVENDVIAKYRDNLIKDGFADAFVKSITNYDTIFAYDYTKGELKVAAGKEAAAGALLINTKTGTFAYTTANVYATGGTGVVDLGTTGAVVTLNKYLGDKDPKKDTNLMKYVPLKPATIQAVAGTADDATLANIKVKKVYDAKAALDAATTALSGYIATAEGAICTGTVADGNVNSNEEIALLVSTLTTVGGSDSNYGTEISAITTLYTTVTGAMDTAKGSDTTFTSEAYEAAVTAYKNAYTTAGTNPSGAVPAASNTDGQNKIDANEAAAATAYHTAVLKVAAEARKVVAEKKAAAQAIKDAGIDPIVQWFTDLETAMSVFAAVKTQDAVEKKDDKRFDNAVAPINDTKSVGKTATKDAYALLIQYTTFTLDKCYPGSSASKTLKEISDLCDKAADLIEKTGDVSFDPLKTENAELAVARQMAIEWVGIAKKDASYKDGNTFNNNKMPYDTAVNADQVYASVNTIYNDLDADLAEFKYSYGDIAETIAEVAAGIDAGIYGASAAAIKAAAEDVAFTLSTFEDTADDGNLVYDDDRNFLGANRLRTKTGRKSQTGAEKKFTKKYEALLAAVEAATAEPEKPEIVMGDLDGDGVPSPADATAALELFLNDEYIEAADMNHDGIITAADAYLILEAWLEA